MKVVTNIMGHAAAQQTSHHTLSFHTAPTFSFSPQDHHLGGMIQVYTRSQNMIHQRQQRKVEQFFMTYTKTHKRRDMQHRQAGVCNAHP